MIAESINPKHLYSNPIHPLEWTELKYQEIELKESELKEWHESGWHESEWSESGTPSSSPSESEFSITSPEEEHFCHIPIPTPFYFHGVSFDQL